MTEPVTTSDGPPPILYADDLASRLASADGLLLGVDFDGTLTTVTEDPDDTEITATNRRALRQLANTRTVRIAVVSGRALSDLRERIGIDRIIYAGNHGLELRRDGTTTVPPAVEQNRPIIQDLIGILETRLTDVDGCIIEDKGVTTAIHYRQVADERESEVRKTVKSVVSERAPDSVQVRTGKAVLELLPAIPLDKGMIIRQLTDDVAPGWFTMYVGDDTTDEDAFQVLADVDDALGVHVGDDATTAAGRRLPDPAAVERALAWLADEGIATFE